ncbi:DUF3226 domain-containing protein [Thermosipho atlanticus]|uniref:Uncharacterized protein n=1 Tax=Thermosipho atlanticus DSM 15807 TaxID=1123380 RepID=A0A1M5RMY7_9BACT|nr:DUF3226 domain-containing protein [Thermosipho atlanticus]SHH27697.1 hypothetical protein SAMN02745199_0518 [Thermosipho atlanticus DSM 15807]
MKKVFPTEINESTIIFVEGKDDEQFLRGLLQKIEIEDYKIIQLNGKNNLNKVLPAAVKVSGFDKVKNILIILDADDSPDNTFKSVLSALKKANLPLPKRPGEPTNNGQIKVGIFLFPDCKNPGTIEDLIIRSFDKNVLNCIKEYINCAEKLGFNPKNEAKSFVYCYIAVQHEPSGNFDVSIKRKHIDLEASVFDNIKEFLKRMVCR